MEVGSGDGEEDPYLYCLAEVHPGDVQAVVEAGVACDDDHGGVRHFVGDFVDVRIGGCAVFLAVGVLGESLADVLPVDEAVAFAAITILYNVSDDLSGAQVGVVRVDVAVADERVRELQVGVVDPGDVAVSLAVYGDECADSYFCTHDAVFEPGLAAEVSVLGDPERRGCD